MGQSREIKSNLAQSLESNHVTDYVQLKLPDVRMFSHIFESILSIPQNKRLHSNRKMIQPKENSATLWHYAENTQWLSIPKYLVYLGKGNFKKKSVRNTRIHLFLKLSEDRTIRHPSWQILLIPSRIHVHYNLHFNHSITHVCNNVQVYT